MATTVAQLIAKLQTLPQDAEVQVKSEFTRGYNTYTEFVEVDLEDIGVYDYTDDQYSISPHVYGRKFVELRGV